MNNRQLFILSNHDEQAEAVELMLRTIETRGSRRIPAKGYLVRERRSARMAHYINERRKSISWPRIMRLTSFLFNLYTVTASVILVAYNIKLPYAISLVLSYEIIILLFILFKPRHHRRHITGMIFAG